MKKFSTLLLSIAIVSGGYYFYSQQILTPKILKDDIYIKNSKVYSVFTDEPISGYIMSKNWSDSIYTKYKKGVLNSKKIVNQNFKLVLQENYNENGLLSGEAYKTINDVNYTLNYKNNILNGKATIGDEQVDFIDGTINGSDILPKYHSKNKINYQEGVPDFIKLDLPSEKYPKNLLVNTIVPENFTGGLLNTGEDETTLFEYNEGALIRIRVYNAGNYGIEGLKIRDVIYGNNNQIKEEFKYENGILKSASSYNDNNRKDGVFYNINLYSQAFYLTTYSDGILNGESQEYHFNNKGELEKIFGFYNLGIYSGDKLKSNEIETYVDGFKTSDLKLQSRVNIKAKIENFKKIPENFTGFNRENHKVIEYKDGNPIKEYTYFDFSTVVKELNKDGSYKESKYKDGLIFEIYNFDKNGVKNGPCTLYVHNDLNGRTIGQMVDGKAFGEFKHYHENNIFFIDIYKGDGTYKRTVYYDYEKNKIQTISKGEFINGTWKEENIANFDKEGNPIPTEKSKSIRYDNINFDTID